jgi:phosphate transport system permease protein
VGNVAARHDRLIGFALATAAASVVAVFLGIVAELLVDGVGSLSLSWLVEAPQDAGRAGGIAPILVSTLILVAIAILVAAPLGVATAVVLAELTRPGHRLAAIVRGSLEVLAAVPSIVFGLFGNAFFSIALGMGFSLLSGGLTLACMALPLIVRCSEEALRAVPGDYRLAAAALGIGPLGTVRRVLLPAAAPGVVVGLVLGIGRAIGETAALLFTSGYVDRMPGSLFDSGRSLSVHIYDLAMNVPGGERAAAGAALSLILLLLAINAATVALVETWQRRRVMV